MESRFTGREAQVTIRVDQIQNPQGNEGNSAIAAQTMYGNGSMNRPSSSLKPPLQHNRIATMTATEFQKSRRQLETISTHNLHLPVVHKKLQKTGQYKKRLQSSQGPRHMHVGRMSEADLLKTFTSNMSHAFDKQYRVAVPPSINQAKAETHENWLKKSQNLSASQKQLSNTQNLFKRKTESKLLGIVGGKDTNHEKISNIDANQILMEEVAKERFKKHMQVITTLSVEDKPTIRKQNPPVAKMMPKIRYVKQLTYQKSESQLQKIIPIRSSVDQSTAEPGAQFRLESLGSTAGVMRPLNQTTSIDWQSVGKNVHGFKSKVVPFLEIFDRSERITAATHCKSGELGYKSPVDRCGAFMEFSSRLKRQHLVDLIQYIRTMAQPVFKHHAEETEEAKKTQLEEWKEQCLFHGKMIFESHQDSIVPLPYLRTGTPEVTTIEQACLIHKVQINAYDPRSSQVSLQLMVDKKWPIEMVKQLETSLQRYLYFVESNEAIRSDEIASYRRDLMEQALNLVPDTLVKELTISIKLLFQEVFISYQRAVKSAIVDYIVRSPDERKRLNIVVLPAPALTASDLQTRFGGYSTSQYPGTHHRVTQSLKLIKQNLITNNIVMSQLLSWFKEFSNINLIDFGCLSQVVSSRNHSYSLQYKTIDIDNFFAFIEAHLEKAFEILRHVWFRGAILITKKFKRLQRRQDGHQPRLWSFKSAGLNPNRLTTKPATTVASTLQKYYWRRPDQATQLEGHSFDSIPYVATNPLESEDDLHETTPLEDLIDVRESVAYQSFAKRFSVPVDLQTNGYDSLFKEYKRELKFGAGNLMNLQMREIVDRSVLTMVEYFSSFKTFEQLYQQNEIKRLRTTVSQVTQLKTSQPKPEIRPSDMQLLKRKTESMANLKLIKGLSCIQLSKNASSIQNDNKPEVKSLLNLPEYIDLQDFCHPIFRLELLLSKADLPVGDGSQNGDYLPEVNPLSTKFIFNKTDDQILNGVRRLYCSLVESMNSLQRPEFCKIRSLSQKDYEKDRWEQEDMALKLMRVMQDLPPAARFRRHNPKAIVVPQNLKEGVFQPDLLSQIFPQMVDFDSAMYPSDSFKSAQQYSRYLGRVKLVHSSADKTEKMFRQQVVRKTQSVASLDEPVYQNHLTTILNVFKDHLRETKNVKEIFTQFDPIVKHHLRDDIDSFLNSIAGDTSFKHIEFLTSFISKVRVYRTLASQLPEKVAFPMFEVGLKQAKTEIKQRVDSILFDIFSKIEQDVANQSQKILAKFKELHETLNKKLVYADDVTEMDAFKASMVDTERDLLVQIEQLKHCSLFLFCNNDLPTVTAGEDSPEQPSTISLIKETLQWPSKLLKIVSEAEERHQLERLEIEKKTLGMKSQLEVNLERLKEDLDHNTRNLILSNFQNQRDQWERMNIQLNDITKKETRIAEDETQLFGSHEPNHKLNRVSKQLKCLYKLCQTNCFYQSQKEQWFSSKVGQLDYQTIASQTAQVKREYQLILEECKDIGLYAKDKLTSKQKKAVSQMEEKDKNINLQQQKVTGALDSLKALIQKVEDLLPIVEVLTLKELRHDDWTQINQILKLEAGPNIGLFQIEGDMNNTEVTQQLQAVAQQSQKLHALRESLTKIDHYWDQQHLKAFSLQVENSRGIQTVMSLDNTQLESLLTLLVQDSQELNKILDTCADTLQEHATSLQHKLSSLQKFLTVLLPVNEHYQAISTRYFKIVDHTSHDEIEFDHSGYDKFSNVWQQVINHLEAMHYKLTKAVELCDLVKFLNTLVRRRKGTEVNLQQ